MSFVVALFLALTSLQSPLSECATWQECRQLAEQAADARDYERFHDLAWRAVQKGPKNDPELMTLLARAQSLSGRPGDALVMLQRLAAMGTVTDAATSDDFRRVRALPAWAEAEPGIRETAARAAAAGTGKRPARADSRAAAVATEPAASSKAAEKPEAPATPATAGKPEATRAAPSEPGRASESRPEVAPAPEAGGEEALRFTTARFQPAGLAHDAVSDRFIVGDRDARKLTVVDEASHRVANLAAAESAGFGEMFALEIDTREGDLWVVTGSGTSGDQRTTVHKLQLVSGRVLFAVPLPDSFGDARLTDVAVSPHSTIVLLDSAGRRIFTMAPKSKTIVLAARLKVVGPSSLAPESDAAAFVAHDGGIARVDLTSGAARPLTSARGVDLRRFARIRWYRGSIVGVQQTDEGRWRIVRVGLDSAGRRATSLKVLDRGLTMPDPTAFSVSGNHLFYLAAPDDAAGRAPETIVRRVSLR